MSFASESNLKSLLVPGAGFGFKHTYNPKKYPFWCSDTVFVIHSLEGKRAKVEISRDIFVFCCFINLEVELHKVEEYYKAQ